MPSTQQQPAAQPHPQSSVRISDKAIHTLICLAIANVAGAIPPGEDRSAIRLTSTELGVAVEVQFAVQYGAPIHKIVMDAKKQIQTLLEHALGVAIIDIAIRIKGTQRR
jgi:uncharacterized alkaline shock family protein YloU